MWHQMVGAFRNAIDATQVSAYTGPGDIATTAFLWGGLRAYSAATAGNAAIRLIRSSDSSQADIATLANGDLNTSDAFFNGSTYKLVTLYDQSSNGLDLTQGTDANRPVFALNTLNGKPTIQFDSSSKQLGPATTTSQNQPVTLSGVFQGPSGISKIAAFCDGSFNIQFGFNNGGADVVYIEFTSGQSASASHNNFHAIQALYNGLTSSLYIDGSSTAAVLSVSNPILQDIYLNGGFNLPGTFNMTEFGLWVSDKSANFAALNSNQTTYWGPF